MNEEVDKRIIEMQFNNKDFLEKIQATTNALNALDEALEFKNAADGSSAIRGFAKATERAMESANDSINSVQVTFSALQVAMITGISELTRVAMKAGVKIFNLLNAPLQQIVSGGKARSMKIQKAQFMLEGLGIAWDDIKEDIDYGVQDTAYGLDAAANVASQLSASGIQIGDQMKTALRGVSGVAAMTSSSYEDIGRIFTTVAGNGRLMGDQLLQLSSRGLNAAQALVTYYKEVKNMSEVTEQSVREMVSKGQVSFADFAAAMDSAFGEHAKDANKTFTGAVDNMKSALSRIGQKFADPVYEGLIPILNGLRKAINMANKALNPLYEQFTQFSKVVSNTMTNMIESTDFLRLVVVILQDIYSWIRPIFGALNNLGLGNFQSAIDSIGDLAEFLKQFQVYGDNAVRLQEVYEAVGETFKTIWFLIVNIADALSPLFRINANWYDALVDNGIEVAGAVGSVGGAFETLGKIVNGLVAVIRTLNPVFRIIIYLASQFIKVNLTKAIKAIKTIISQINWEAVINGLAVIINEAIKLGKIIFNLAVLYVPKIINLIGYAPAIIAAIKSVANVIVKTSLIIVGTIATVASAIYSKFRAIINFFSTFSRSINGAADDAEEAADRMEDSQSRVSVGATGGSFFRGRQANILGGAAPAMLAMANATGKELSEVDIATSDTEKHIHDMNYKVSDLSKLILKFFDLIGITSESAKDKAISIGNTITNVLSKIKDGIFLIISFIGGIISNAIKAIKEQLKKPTVLLGAILTGLGILIFTIISKFFMLLDGLVGLLTETSIYDRKLGNAEIIKSISLVVLSLTGLIAAIGLVSYFVEPSALEVTLNGLANIFDFLWKVIYYIGLIVIAVTIFSSIAPIIAATVKRLSSTKIIGKSVLTLSTNIVTVMLAFGVFFGSLAAALYVLKDYDIDDLKERIHLLGTMMVAVGVSIIAFMGFAALFGAAARSTTTTTTTISPLFAIFKGKKDTDVAGSNTTTMDKTNPLAGVIGIIVGFGFFFMALASAMYIMDQVNPRQIDKYFGIMMKMMLTVTGLISLLMIISKSISAKSKGVRNSEIFAGAGRRPFALFGNRSQRANDSEFSTGNATLDGLSGAIFTIGLMFMAIAGSMKILDSIKNQSSITKYAVILGAIAGSVLVCIAIITGLQARMAKNLSGLGPKSGNTNMAAFTSISEIIKALSMMLLSIAGSLFIISGISNLKKSLTALLEIAIGVLLSVIGLGAIFSRSSFSGKGSDSLKNIAKLFEKLSGFLIAISLSMLIISMIGDPGMMIAAGAVMAGLVLAISGAVAILSTVSKNTFLQDGKNILATFGLLAMIIGSIALLIPIMNILSGMSVGQILSAVLLIDSMVIIIGAMTFLMSVGSQFVSPSGLLMMLFSVITIVGSIISIALVLQSIDTTVINNGILTIANIAVFIGIVMVALGAIGAIIAYVPFVAGAIAVGVIAFAAISGLILVFASLFAIAIRALTVAFDNMKNVDFSVVSVFASSLIFAARGINEAAAAFAGAGGMAGILVLVAAIYFLAGAMATLSMLDGAKVEQAGTAVVKFLSDLAKAFSENENLSSTMWNLIGMLAAVSIAIIIASVALLTASISLLASAILLAGFGIAIAFAGGLIVEGVKTLIKVFDEIQQLFVDNVLEIIMGASALVLLGTLMIISGTFMLVGSVLLGAGALFFLAGVSVLVEACGMMQYALDEFHPGEMALFFLEMAGTLLLGGVLMGVASLAFSAGAAAMITAGVLFIVAMTELEAGSELYNIAAANIQNGTEAIIGALQAVVDFLDRLTGGNFTSILTNLTGVINSASEGFYSVADNIFSGLAEGVNNGVDWVQDMGETCAENFRTGFEYIMGINSPSTVAADWGNYIVAGLSNGINGSKKQLKKTMNGLADTTAGAYEDAMEIDSPSARMYRDGEWVEIGLEGGIENRSSQYYEAMYGMGERGVEAFVDGTEVTLEEAEPEVEVEETPWYANLTSGFSSIVNWIRQAGENIDVGTFMDKIRGIGDVVTGFLNGEHGEFSLENISNVLTEIFPDLFGEGGLLAGTSLGENLIDSIMGYGSQVAAAGAELRNTFNNAFGGNQEHLAENMYRQASRIANSGYDFDTGLGGNQQDILALQRMLDENNRRNPNSRFRTVQDVMAEYNSAMGRYNQLSDEDVLNNLGGAGSITGSGGDFTSGTSTVADEAAKSTRGTNINSNNTTTNNYNYTQNNYSPEPIDRIDVYRQTEYALGMLGNWNLQ